MLPQKHVVRPSKGRKPLSAKFCLPRLSSVRRLGNSCAKRWSGWNDWNVAKCCNGWNRLYGHGPERAGVANEILIWITLLSMMGNLKPSFSEYVCEKGWSTAATLATWHPE
jgi:hypothetical protein